MKDSIAQKLANVIRTYEDNLKNAAKGNPRKENALRLGKANIPYEIVAPFMSKENLALLGRQKMSRRMLCSLSRNKLRHEDRFLFWEAVLSAGECIPVEWRASIFLDCLRSSESWEPRERNGKVPYYNGRDYDKAELADYVVSSKWLVDAPLVRKWYCRLHKPGCELLTCIDQKREGNYPLRNKLLLYIEKDDLPGFGMLYTMSGAGTCWTLVRDILHKGAIRIFEWLLENEPSMSSAIKPYHLMVYAVANLTPKAAIEVVNCLELHSPGTVVRVDEFGNNLLWYSLHNKKARRDEHLKELIAFLCNSGCNPDSRNHLGLSYGDVRTADSTTKHRNGHFNP